MTLTDLESKSIAELEDIYSQDPSPYVPEGVYRGTVLHWLPVPDSESLLMRPLIWFGFGLVPFGVDFTQRRWFFGLDQSPRLGRFRCVVGPSYWNAEDQAVQLHYEPSSLPSGLKRHLYDEVKPLSEDLCLGLGGVNTKAGPTRAFLFALERKG